MTAQPHCQKCNSEYTYEDRDLIICSMCAHEWKKDENVLSDPSKRVVKDAYGNILKDGDTVTVIKDLKVKGSSSVVKVGTKVKNIKLVDSDHDIDCRIEGIGPMGLKSQFVKKI
ncbi:MAG: Alkylphosphonate utilization operon protein PhnA [uncultured bacterium]|nr:MAG: Alkylphosphonate utilization operon protein PhnA [uncultured bacterium]